MSDPVQQLDVLRSVQQRLIEAQRRHGDFQSLHEFFSVLLEEVDELRDEIRRRDVDFVRTREEALDVAVVVCRLLVELDALAERMKRRCSIPGG